MKRRIKVGKYSAAYDERICLFPSQVYRFKYLPTAKQVLNVEDYGTEKKIIPFSEEERYLTQFLRSNSKRLGRIFNMSKLVQKPMYSMEDGSSLLLPLDNQVGFDYLTFRHPLYHKLIVTLADKLAKRSGVDDSVLDSLRTWFVDYSYWVPYNSGIRHDGRFRLGQEWPIENVKFFSRELSPLLLGNFLDAGSHLEDFLPTLNSSKSCGWNTRNPDGTPFKRDEYMFVPTEWEGSDNFESAKLAGAVRYNFGPFKRSWLDSGRVTSNLKFFLENCDHYKEPKTLLQAFNLEALSVHTEAFRTNNADVPKGEINNSFADLLDRCWVKDRDFAYEKEECVFSTGIFDNLKWSTRFRELNPEVRLASLKKRSMFPAPNASFSPPFIFLFRSLLKRIEEGCTGFPSNTNCVMSRYHRVFEKHRGEKVFYITFDRRTAEQFISDNWEKIKEFFSPELSAIIDGLATVVLPSAHGPRVVTGGLTSGTAQTTFLNAITGIFEMINTVCHVEHLRFEQVCPIILDVIFHQKDDVKIGSHWYLFNLGTDDQICVVFGEPTQISNSYWEARRLSGEVTDHATVFGLDFTPSGVRVSSTLGLSKLFLQEKVVLGDAIALKMACRLSCLPDYYDDIASVFSDLKLGSIGGYSKGADSYMKNVIGKFGYAIDPIYNEYNPSEKLIFGRFLSDAQIREPQKFKVSDVAPWYDLFKSFLKI